MWLFQSEFFHGKKEMIKRVFSPGLLPEDDEMMVDEGATGEGATGEVSPTSSAGPPSPLCNLDDIVTS